MGKLFGPPEKRRHLKLYDRWQFLHMTVLWANMEVYSQGQYNDTVSSSLVHNGT